MKKIFNKKKVLITGCTGFKGSWLSLWMNFLDANVLGVANNIVSSPSFFNICNLKNKIKFKKIDIRNFKKFKKVILDFKPEFIFHLAAEAVLKKSYDNPKYTWETNLLGTVNLLESLREIKNKTNVVIVTSDKVYKNLELKRGYVEEDKLGGLDPYSSSKASADLACQSYIRHYLKKKNNINISIARAGNVIGGGDWSYGRLIPDCVRMWSKNKAVKIRNPKSTRPWQHVLDVLNGYMLLAAKLKRNKKLNGEIFNFGPKVDKKNKNKVINIVNNFCKIWNDAKYTYDRKNYFIESNLLQLNSTKAKKKLGWECKFTTEESIYLTAAWYKEFYTNSKKNLYKLSLEHIKNFTKINSL